MSKSRKRTAKTVKTELNMLKRQHEQNPASACRSHQPVGVDLLNQHLDLGIRFCQTGQLSQAVTCFQQVLQSEPDNPDAWHLWGVVAAQQQQYPTAIEHINRAIGLKPTEAIFYSNLGNVYMQQHQILPASECFHKALQCHPNNPDSHRQLAIACEKLLDSGIQHHQDERLPEAAICDQQVFEHQPECADAWHLWGVIACEEDDYAAALERIYRAIEMNPAVASF